MAVYGIPHEEWGIPDRGRELAKSADDGRSEGAVYGRAVRLERFKTV